MTESEEVKSRQVAQALLAVASSIQAVAQAMLGDGEKKSTEADHKKRTKKDKDPNAPKRNLTSYIYFVQDVRQSVVEEDPSLSAVDVARILGKKWNSLSDKEKKPYIELAEEDKSRFNKEFDEYKSANGIASTPSKKSSSSNIIKPKVEETKKRPAAPAAAVSETPSKKKAKAAKASDIKQEPKQEKKKGNKKK